MTFDSTPSDISGKHSFKWGCSVIPDFANERMEIVETMGWPDQMKEVHRQYINLKEQAIWDALIQLGWTPPTN